MIKKLINKKVIFAISIVGLIFIFFKFNQYKNKVQENLLIEHLENSDEKDKDTKDKDTKDKKTENKNNKDTKDKKLYLKNNNPDDIMKYVVETVKGAILGIRPDTVGPVGPIGPKGEKGSSGGTFSDKGMLRSINNPNLFLERQTNNLDVNNASYEPTQIWTHTPDGKITNLLDKTCLNYKDDNTLEMKTCLNSRNWDYVSKNSLLRARTPLGGKYYCLTLGDNPKNGKGKRYSVRLTECNNRPEQMWSFY